jgi:uncharacterized damage-inducible protein DinB
MEKALRERIIGSAAGSGAHVKAAAALEHLTVAQARRHPSRRLATIWEELGHVVFWQDFILDTIKGGTPQAPAHAAGSWPPMPKGRGAAKRWDALVARFLAGLGEAEKLARKLGVEARVGRGKKSALGGHLLMLGSHNSYHLGQIVSLRKLIGAWPPPSGGVTW